MSGDEFRQDCLYTLDMPPRTNFIIIVARPGRRRESLAVLVESVFAPARVILVGDCQQAEGIIDEVLPGVLILDHTLTGQDVEPCIAYVKNRLPDTRIVRLENMPGQVSKGADAVLLDGFTPADLLAAIQGPLNNL